MRITYMLGVCIISPANVIYSVFLTRMYACLAFMHVGCYLICTLTLKKKAFSKNWLNNNPKIIRDFYGGMLSEDLLYCVKNKKCCPAVCLNSKHF